MEDPQEWIYERVIAWLLAVMAVITAWVTYFVRGRIRNSEKFNEDLDARVKSLELDHVTRGELNRKFDVLREEQREIRKETRAESLAVQSGVEKVHARIDEIMQYLRNNGNHHNNG